MMATGGERCRQSLVRYLQELHSEPPTEPRDPGRNSDQSFYMRVMSARFQYPLQIREVSTCGQKLCNSAQQQPQLAFRLTISHRTHAHSPRSWLCGVWRASRRQNCPFLKCARCRRTRLGQDPGSAASGRCQPWPCCSEWNCLWTSWRWRGELGTHGEGRAIGGLRTRAVTEKDEGEPNRPPPSLLPPLPLEARPLKIDKVGSCVARSALTPLWLKLSVSVAIRSRPFAAAGGGWVGGVTPRSQIQ